MIDTDISRLSRLTAILTLLLSKSRLRASDIADKFNISTRTVYRDMRTLEQAGVPIVSEAGYGYTLAEGYKLPPIMFTQEEALSFLTAEKFIQKLADKQTSVAYESAINKIKSVLKTGDKSYLENLAQNIEVLKNPYLPERTNDNQFIQDILKSISNKTALNIDYETVNTSNRTSRTVEPVGIYFAYSRWYLIAFCLLRNDYRNFRIDNISRLNHTQQTIQQKHPTLKTYLEQLTENEQEVQKVVIRIDKDHLHCLGEQKYYMGYVEERSIEDVLEMTFLTASMENFARAYLMFGDRAEIVEPESLKELVKTIGEKVLKNLHRLKTY